MEENAHEALVSLKLSKGFDLNAATTVNFVRESSSRERGGSSDDFRASGFGEAMSSEKLEKDLSSRSSEEKSIDGASDDANKEINMEAGSQSDSELESDSEPDSDTSSSKSHV